MKLFVLQAWFKQLKNLHLHGCKVIQCYTNNNVQAKQKSSTNLSVLGCLYHKRSRHEVVLANEETKLHVGDIDKFTSF